ncbi:MAG: hypothetical protein KBC62_02370 [Candidatus Pacebacteria bacterium]|nr:hypothetical protein [Candidatus Paceibacterota bacterium]
MELLITDECSITWDTNIGYFIYGGIVVNETEAKPLAEAVLKIKQQFGLPKKRPIKWNNIKWQGTTLDEEVQRNVKDAVLTVFSESQSKIIVCLSPHNFYHNQTIKSNGKAKMSIDPATQVRSHEYGLNDVLCKFDSYLGLDKYGMVLADKFGEAVKSHMDQHCRDCFPNGTRNLLTNIVHPVIQLDNEDSHLHQINDVVLGAIYMSLREMEHNFLPRIKNNFWSSEGENPTILGYGFNVYPLAPRFGTYQRAKSNLQRKFNRLIETV